MAITIMSAYIAIQTWCMAALDHYKTCGKYADDALAVLDLAGPSILDIELTRWQVLVASTLLHAASCRAVCR